MRYGTALYKYGRAVGSLSVVVLLTVVCRRTRGVACIFKPLSFETRIRLKTDINGHSTVQIRFRATTKSNVASRQDAKGDNHRE